MFSRRILTKISLFIFGLFLCACLQAPPSGVVKKIIIGVVSYEKATDIIEEYQEFRDYLSKETKTFVELEPTFNERQAIEQIERQTWSIVFAPPGIAAIAIVRDGYLPVLPLAEGNTRSSAIVVRADSDLQELRDLSQKKVALGQRGSATGYYLPLYDLFGLTLKEIRFAPTPRTVLQWLEEGSIDAGALSTQQLELYREDFNTEFRILHETRSVPSGLVLVSADLDPELRSRIKEVMRNAPAELTQKAGYVTNTEVPDYLQFIILVNKVRPLESKLNQQPVVLTNTDPE